MTGGPGAQWEKGEKKGLRGALAVSLGLSFPGRPSWAGSSFFFSADFLYFLFSFLCSLKR
jgi:hypothetical protein